MLDSRMEAGFGSDRVTSARFVIFSKFVSIWEKIYCINVLGKFSRFGKKYVVNSWKMFLFCNGDFVKNDSCT